MSGRAASSTAVLVCQGRAAADGRYAVGLFSDPMARGLLDPAEQAVVDRVRAGRGPTSGRERAAHEMVRHTSWGMVPRTVAIDAAIREHAATQVVVLGAGLDTRAWRMPELAGATVFEVDHTASQRDKRRRLGGLVPVAGRVAAVAVDLAQQPLGPALGAAGFDPRLPTTWVWEGVVPYLTPAQVRATLGQVAQLSAPGSRLVVNYQAKSLAVTVLRAAVRLALRLERQADPMAGEPWRSLWRPEEMRDLLSRSAFQTTSDESLFILAEGLGLPQEADRSLRNGRVAVAVRR
jgi:methyltransferase (TIGR00027 family)